MRTASMCSFRPHGKDNGRAEARDQEIYRQRNTRLQGFASQSCLSPEGMVLSHADSHGYQVRRVPDGTFRSHVAQRQTQRER